MSINNKIKIYTLGCKVNQYDSNCMKARLELLGFDFVDKNANFSIVNTCAVTKTAIKKAQKIIKFSENENPGALICVSGCWPQAYKKDVVGEYGPNVFGVGEIDKLVEFIKAKADLKTEYKHGDISVSDVVDKSRYTIKIQDGCEQFCSYCIIPYTRGKLRSREEGVIVDEVLAALNNGFREVVLSGIHLGLYGINEGTDIVKLLKKLIVLPDLGRIRLSSIEVNEVTSELIELIAGSDKICNHLHIPLQSGDDKILKLMNRPYKIDLFRKKIEELRNKIPLIAITTDVIVGFPGETEKNYNNTYEFVRNNGFSRLHVFPFSAHEKTPAAKMKNKVDRAVIRSRAKNLRELGKDLKRIYKNKFIKTKQSIAVERIVDGCLYGKSEYYVSYKIEMEKIKRMEGLKEVCVGDIVSIEL